MGLFHATTPYLGIHASRYAECPRPLGEDTRISDQLYRVYSTRA